MSWNIEPLLVHDNGIIVLVPFDFDLCHLIGEVAATGIRLLM